MIRRTLVVASVLATAACQDWNSAVEECRRKGGCRGGTGGGSQPGEIVLVFEPGELDAGLVVPTESGGVEFVVRNTGFGTATNLRLTSTESRFVPTGGCLGTTLAPDASCQARIDFTPTQVGAVNGVMRASSDGVAQPFEAPAYAAGVSPLAVEPTTWDFGVVTVNASSRKSFVVTNLSSSRSTGNLSIAIQSPFLRDAGSCVGKLDAGATCSFEYAFAPTSAGPFDAGLLGVTTNQPVIPGRPDEVARVALRGEGRDGLSVTPSSWSSVVQLGKSEEQTFVVNNSFPTPVGPLMVTLVQGMGVFSLDAGSCDLATISSTSPCVLSVRYTPLAANGPQDRATLLVAGPGTNTFAQLYGLSPTFSQVSVFPVPDGGVVTVVPLSISCPGGLCIADVNPSVSLMATATATPNFGMKFDGWTSNCSSAGSNPQCTFEAAAGKTFGANFSRASFPVTVQPSAQGTVQSAPAGISCPPACDAGFLFESRVVLRATPRPGHVLRAWGGECLGQPGERCELDMDGGAHSVQTDFVEANTAFVSRASWPNGPISGADTLCQNDAADAGLPGADTYLAWLSGAPGVRDLGWTRSDGRPIAASFAELVNDGGLWPLHYPINRHADGTAAGSVLVATATGALRTSAASCTNFTSTSTSLVRGNVQSTVGSWTDSMSSACGAQPHQLYCFGNHDAGIYVPPVPPPGSRRAFLTAGTSQALTSNTSMDSLCNAEAQAAGLPGTFVGFRSSNLVTATSRITNYSGAGWYRVDGAEVVVNPTDLGNVGAWATPIAIDAKGLAQSGCVWLGAVSPGSLGAAGHNCSNYTNGASTVMQGRNVELADQGWLTAITIGCVTGLSCHFYCVQQ